MSGTISDVLSSALTRLVGLATLPRDTGEGSRRGGLEQETSVRGAHLDVAIAAVGNRVLSLRLGGAAEDAA